jgi:hypothetical protein
MEVERSVRLMTTLGKGRCLTSPCLRSADFSEFLKVISSQKTKTAGMDDESDTGAACPHCTPCPFHGAAGSSQCPACSSGLSLVPGVLRSGCVHRAGW